MLLQWVASSAGGIPEGGVRAFFAVVLGTLEWGPYYQFPYMVVLLKQYLCGFVS